MSSTTRRLITTGSKPNSLHKTGIARVSTADIDERRAHHFMSGLIEDDMVTPIADQRVLVHEPRSEAFESIFENAGGQSMRAAAWSSTRRRSSGQRSSRRRRRRSSYPTDRGHRSRRHGRDECGRAGVRGIADPFDQKFPRCRTHAVLTNGLKSKAFPLRGHTL